MSDQDLLNILREGGGIVIAAYLVWWMTRKLNGKFDRLTGSVERLNENIETLLREK